MAKLVLHIDDQKTVEEETMNVIISNVSKVPEIAKAESKDLSLYANGIEMNARIFKDATVLDGLRAVAGSDIQNINWINWVTGITNDAFEVSADNGETKYPISMTKAKLNDSQKEKIAQKIHDTSDKLIKGFWKGMHGSTKNKLFDLGVYYEQLGGVIGFINDEYTTPTSFRFQMIFPNDHPRRAAFSPDESPIKFYYTFDGYLYELKTTYTKGIGEFYEWEVSGLEPGSIYPGFSFSMDGGNSIFPSTGLFGITRNEDGTLPDFDEAELRKPWEQAGYKPHQMWNEELAHKFMGPELTKVTYDVIVKKQFEFENDEDYVPLSRVEDFYANFDWLKTGKEVK